MNDIRRTILWVIFGFSMVLLWDQWQIHNGQKPTFFPQPATAPANKTPAAADGAAIPAPVATSAAGAGVSAVPGAVPASAPTSVGAVPSSPAQPASVKKERVEVKTDVLQLSFDSEGGSVVRSVFNKYGDLKDASKGFVLFDESRDRVYVAQSGLIDQAGVALPTHKTVMTVLPGERELKDGQDQLELKFESPVVGGVKLLKTYVLKRGAYDITVRHELFNGGAAPVTPQVYMQLVRDGNKPEGESAFYSTFTGPAVYTDLKKYQKVEFTDIEKNKVEAEKQSNNGYIAMVQHYFASAWLLGDNVQRDMFLRKVDTNLYAVGMIAPLKALAPGASQVFEAKLFVGPQEEKTLESLSPGLELVKDYGWLTILSKPLYWLLDKLHSFLHNWGWAIVALVLLLKISALAGAPLPVLLAAPVWARWLLLLAARRPAARPGGMAARWDLALTWPQLLAAGLLPLAVTAIGGSWHWPLWLAAPAAGLAGWGVLRLAERRLGGVTGDVFGAVVETSEAVFVCAACLQPFSWT